MFTRVAPAGLDYRTARVTVVSHWPGVGFVGAVPTCQIRIIAIIGTTIIAEVPLLDTRAREE
jgi:hypothetical protein